MVIYLGSVKGGCNGRSKVIPLIARQVPPPSFILIQLVSHNLGITKTIDLINNIECDLLRLNVILPGLKSFGVKFYREGTGITPLKVNR